MAEQALEQRVANLEQKMERVVFRDELAEIVRSIIVRLDSIDGRFEGVSERLDASWRVQVDCLGSQFDAFRDEQRSYNESSGQAWERLDKYMTMSEEDRSQIFNRLDAVKTALENRGG